MNIIGINAFHADSAACLVINGQLITAVEEERFNRIKHWAGFPIESIKYCLKSANLKISDIEKIISCSDRESDISQVILNNLRLEFLCKRN